MFPDSDIWALYQSCRKRNIPAKLVLETTENSEEICTFSSKGPSQPAALKPANPPPPPVELSRRKSHSKLKKDSLKWKAWLERKLKETREENPFPPENLSTPPVSQCYMQGNHEQLPTSEPSSQPREEDVLCTAHEE